MICLPLVEAVLYFESFVVPKKEISEATVYCSAKSAVCIFLKRVAAKFRSYHQKINEILQSDASVGKIDFHIFIRTNKIPKPR